MYGYEGIGSIYWHMVAEAAARGAGAEREGRARARARKPVRRAAGDRTTTACRGAQVQKSTEVRRVPDRSPIRARRRSETRSSQHDRSGEGRESDARMGEQCASKPGARVPPHLLRERVPVLYGRAGCRRRCTRTTAPRPSSSRRACSSPCQGARALRADVRAGHRLRVTWIDGREAAGGGHARRSDQPGGLRTDGRGRATRREGAGGALREGLTGPDPRTAMPRPRLPKTPRRPSFPEGAAFLRAGSAPPLSCSGRCSATGARADVRTTAR